MGYPILAESMTGEGGDDNVIRQFYGEDFRFDDCGGGIVLQLTEATVTYRTFTSAESIGFKAMTHSLE